MEVIEKKMTEVSTKNQSKTSKKFLSNKRTSKQTIVISPALKEWIERYVNVNRRKNPGDER